MAVPNEFYEQISEEHLKNLSFIGKGSFGNIFRARHQKWGTDVAIKFLSGNSSFTREELLNEARAMDKARFSYVLRLYGLFVGKMPIDATSASAIMPNLGLVMEYMENGNLSNLMCQVPSMPWALRFRILYEVALGMNFLHNLNPPLLHLDLKPSNILLDGELHVRVSDFGLSKFKRGTTQQCNLNSGEKSSCGGTLEFMPPESFVDFKYKPAPSTDVYSYGILIWSVLSNQEPYHNLHNANMSSLIKMHIPRGQRPQTEDLEKQVDQVLQLANVIDLMKRCWSNEKDQRPSFQDCREKMEVVNSCYKWKITPAVREIQDILMQKNSSFRTEANVPPHLSSKGASLAPATSEGYRAFTPTSGLEEHLKTIHLEEMSSVQNEAVPSKVVLRKKSLGNLHRSKSMCNRDLKGQSRKILMCQKSKLHKGAHSEIISNGLVQIHLLLHYIQIMLHFIIIHCHFMAPTKVIFDLLNRTSHPWVILHLQFPMVGFKSVAAASQEFKLEVETTCMLNKLLGQNMAVTNEC